jgi:hypothetical protein
MNTRTVVGAVLFVLALPLSAQDFTPPIVTPNVSGTVGANGWFVSDVALSWTIVDDESPLLLTIGCEPMVLQQDDTKRTFTCVATSHGGSTVASYEIGRDATPPQITYLGNAGRYTLGQPVIISCVDTDVTSGIATSTCTDIIGDASLFNLGINTFTSTATDFAGNTTTASVTFEVVSSLQSLFALIDQMVTKESVARNLKKWLERGDIDAFTKLLIRETGRSISPADAATLLRLVAAL